MGVSERAPEAVKRSQAGEGDAADGPPAKRRLTVTGGDAMAAAAEPNGMSQQPTAGGQNPVSTCLDGSSLQDVPCQGCGWKGGEAYMLLCESCDAAGEYTCKWVRRAPPVRDAVLTF